MGTRIERDSLGEIEVSDDVYWGAQTQRSLKYFHAGTQVMHPVLIESYGWIKLAAAEINCELGILKPFQRDLIVQAAREVIEGKLKRHFPLRVWQTGSGTHTNMNVNEVIANRATELAGGKLGSHDPIHPNDHVNRSQSTNDSFPTAMSLAAVTLLSRCLIPAVIGLRDQLKVKMEAFQSSIKTGRTHLMDATPISIGQEFSGYINQIENSLNYINRVIPALSELAIGGTAVGTGLNAPKQFGPLMAERLSTYLKYPFVQATNLFSAIACHDPFVMAHGALKTLATALIKIATDLSWMVSGPTCGLGELFFQVTEPGSSIMAGKGNPTQCEALTMVCVHLFGNDAAIGMAGSRGNFELNVLKPLIIHNFLESTELLADSISLFTTHFLETLRPNSKKLEHYLQSSLMLVTALIPTIGYDKAAEVAKKALQENLTLKEAAVQLQCLTAAQYDRLVDPKNMI